MPDATLVDGLRSKYNALIDERGRRRWAASEAIAIGRGGIAAVATATGLSDRTVKNGIAELKSKVPLTSGRQRRPGGGRKSLESHQAKLVAAIEALVEPSERGDPQSPLRAKQGQEPKRKLRQDWVGVHKKRMSKPGFGKMQLP